jgi:hypothetical protein
MVETAYGRRDRTIAHRYRPSPFTTPSNPRLFRSRGHTEISHPQHTYTSDRRILGPTTYNSQPTLPSHFTYTHSTPTTGRNFSWDLTCTPCSSKRDSSQTRAIHPQTPCTNPCMRKNAKLQMQNAVHERVRIRSRIPNPRPLSYCLPQRRSSQTCQQSVRPLNQIVNYQMQDQPRATHPSIGNTLP